MQLSWFDPGNIDQRAVEAAVALREAARTLDSPHQVSDPTNRHLVRLVHGWDGHPPLTAFAWDHGRMVGMLQVDLPHWDNTHAADIEVTVDPVFRRRGYGRRLFDIGVERARAEGRRLVMGGGFDTEACIGFTKAVGLDKAYDEVQRRQDLTAVDWDQVERLYADALDRAAGYELLYLPGRVPDDLLDDVVAMTAAINDAPTDSLEIEDEVFSAERMRAFEASQDRMGRRMHRIVAREVATGALAGHTQVGVPEDHPGYGWQFDTSVLRAHRGHRLGLLLKAAMMRYLREAEPQLRRLDTWNAASNSHMIGVNELLSYEVVATASYYQKHI